MDRLVRHQTPRRKSLCLYFSIILATPGVHPGLFGGIRVAHLFRLFVLSYYMSLRSEFRVVMSVTIST